MKAHPAAQFKEIEAALVESGAPDSSIDELRDCLLRLKIIGASTIFDRLPTQYWMRSSYAAPKIPLRLGITHCEKLYAGLPRFGEEINATHRGIIKKRWESLNLQSMMTTHAEVEGFLSSGWPELQKIAASEGKSVPDLMKEIFELETFAREGIGTSEVAKKLNATIDTYTLNALAWLEKKQKIEVKKLKPHELMAVTYVIRVIQDTAMFAMHGEHELFGVSVVNPLLPVNAQQVRHVFKSLEDVGEEAALAIALSKPKAAAVVQASTHAPAPELQAERAVADSKPTLAPKQAQRSEQPVELSNFLEPDGELIDHQVYKFRNADHEDYLIHFSHEVVKDSHKGQERNIKKLLSTLYLTNNGKSGIKYLHGMKDVIEIKAHMRGHKRLIGCIKGRTIEIKRFYEDIPASGNAYSRLIPSNLCAD